MTRKIFSVSCFFILFILSGFMAACGPTLREMCEQTCVNGICNQQGTCGNCTAGWKGENCDQEDLCAKKCAHGKCDTKGICVCDKGYLGTWCTLNPDEWMAAKVICPGDPGRLTVTRGETPYRNYSGFYADVFPERCAWVLMEPALPPAKEDPGRPGEWIQNADVRVLALDRDNPDEREAVNHVKLLAKPGIFLKGHRSTVLLKTLIQGAAASLEAVNMEVRQDGAYIISEKLGIYRLLNTPPVLAVAPETKSGSREVIFDFTGTMDEKSATPFMLKFSVLDKDGNPVKLEPIPGETHKFRAVVAGGNHSFTAKTEDPYGKTDSKPLAVKVDLCSSKACAPYQTCREIDGECIGADPCIPSPCKNGGTCSVSSEGKAVCSCPENWKGNALCETCSVGYTGDDCHRDWCKDQTCSNHGKCVAEKCECGKGYGGETCADCDTTKGYKPDGSGSCIADLCFGKTCPSDGDACNGIEYCNPSNGQCEKKEAITCKENEECKAGKCVCQEGYGPTDCTQCDTAKGYLMDSTGKCVASKCIGNTCDDNNPCNGIEKCEPLTGACIPGIPVSCPDDGDKCNGTEACDKISGKCVSQNPLVCDDGKTCSGTETCNPSIGCVAGKPVTCSNGGICQEPSGTCKCPDGYSGADCSECDTVKGYLKDPSGKCVLSKCFNVNCDDGNKCNGIETCDPLKGCIAGAPLACDDGDKCNGIETCDPIKGCQPGTPLTCDNGDVCDGKETCDKVKGCMPGTPLKCDDGNKCNGTETCHKILGCQLGTPLVCNDGKACNGTETCNPSTGCVAGTTQICYNGGTCNEPNAACTCTGYWTPVSRCAQCPPNFNAACTGCATGYKLVSGQCVKDLCYGVSCNGHGTCVQTTGICSCTGGWSGDYCLTPPPKPGIWGLGINCNVQPWPGHCAAGETNYEVSFYSSNAVSYTVTVTKISGAGTAGTAPSGGTIAGSLTKFVFITGNNPSDIMRITVIIRDQYGQTASAYIDVVQE